MQSPLVKRLLTLPAVFLGITLVSFAVIHLAPGSPVSALSDMNPKMTEKARQKMTELYGLDKPLLVQYGHWVKGIVSLDFGRSFVDNEPVTKKIAKVIPITFTINFLALIFILLIGIYLGVVAAANQGKPIDSSITFLTLAGFSVPTFWFALILMSFFGVTLHWLPVSGITSLLFDQMNFFEKVWDVTRHLVLPILVSSLTGLAGVARFMRQGMMDVLAAPFIRTARAKGLNEGQVLYKHALKNALLPIITLVGLSIPGLLGGSVIFESVFSIPGMGRLFYNSVFARDYPVIMGILVLGAGLTLIGNLLADIAYRYADPRIRQ